MIVDKTSGKTLAKSYKTYVGLMQAKGLMFSVKRAAVFHFNKPRKAAIHTWFVFYPIDLLFLDSGMKVIEKKENLRPFSSYSSKKEASHLIELPSNSGKSVSVGNRIRFK
jgi:uncharacterized protein